MLVVPQWARPALGAMLAAAVTFVPMDSAFASVDTTALLAGRSGGRVGGRVSAPRMAPRSGGGGYGGGYGGGRTNIYVAPPMGGYGMGYGMGYGGYGYGGGNGVGLYLGLSLAETFIREQQRQAFLQQQLRTQQELGADQAQIQLLRQELEAQNAKVDSLRSQQGGAPSLSPQAAPGESEAVRQLQQQLLQQQKELESLKAAQAK